MGISLSCLLMEAFVNSFVDIFVCFLHCLVVSDQYSLKNAITGQIFYQKSHISVTLSLPDSTTIQNLDKIRRVMKYSDFYNFSLLEANILWTENYNLSLEWVNNSE